MEISNAVRKRRVGLLLLLPIIAMVFLLGAQTTAFATGADVTITGVKNFSGASITASDVLIELYLGDIKPFSTSDPFVNPAAVKQDEKLWKFSGGSYGKGIGSGDNALVYGRVWAEGTRAKGISNHYGLATDTTSGPGDNAKAVTWNIGAIYRAWQPFDPYVKQLNFSNITNYTAAGVKTTEKTLVVNWGQKLPGTGEDAEITAVKWRYIKPGQAQADVEIANTNAGDYGQLAIKSPADGTYTFSVALKNTWGETDYSSPITYDLASGGGAGSYPITVEVVANKPGFNFISIPMPPNTKTGTWLATTADGATSLGKIATAYDLVKAINYAAGKGTGKKFISTFGKWDATGQLDAGILIPANDPDGTAKAALQAIKLEAGVGYQVYLGKDPATNLWPSEVKTTIIIKN